MRDGLKKFFLIPWLVAAFIFLPLGEALAADQRIQYTEEMVGAGHPTKADTLNRLTLVEHNTDGTHKNVSTLPWNIFIPGFAGPDSNTNWNSPEADAGSPTGWRNISSGAQNAQLTFNVVLAAGTWTIAVWHSKGSNRGVYSVYLDATDLGDIDGYAGSSSFTVDELGSIAVSTTGKKVFKLKMETKNGSSSDYYGSINLIHFRRTA